MHSITLPKKSLHFESSPKSNLAPLLNLKATRNAFMDQYLITQIVQAFFKLYNPLIWGKWQITTRKFAHHTIQYQMSKFIGDWWRCQVKEFRSSYQAKISQHLRIAVLIGRNSP